MPAPARRPPRASRPGYLAPPPLLRESEAFEGAAILREHPDSLGTLLWKTLRDLAAWTESPPEARPGLFPPGAAQAREAEIAACGVEPEAWGPLLVVARLLAGGGADHPRLLHACRTLARWAGRRGMPAVHLAFTQAAARLAPTHPRLAYAVGRLARDRGEHARGESWLREAIRLARGRDWYAYALAYLSLGTLYQQLGNFPAARAVTLRGYRTSRRRRVRELEGVALHNLFAITAEMLEFGRAHRYALSAARAYGAGHPRLHALVNDLGCFWVLHGWFQRAADIFQSALPGIVDPEERVVVLGNLARACAASGRRERYEGARAEAERLLEAEDVAPERAAQAWINLARGAASLRDHPSARRAAERSLAVSAAVPLGRLRLEAESLLAAIARPCEPAVAPAPFLPEPGSEADAVAACVVELMSAG